MNPAHPVVLITGASRGIGKAIAHRFAAENFRLIISARDEPALEAVARELLTDYGAEALVAPADLKKVKEIEAVVELAQEVYGDIDILVNNAGILHLKPFADLTLSEFDEMLAVNIRAVFALTHLVIPGMVLRGSGTVVNIASLAGKNGFKNGTGYAATKFAMRGFAASLMQEVREHDVRVMTVFPGSVHTRMIGRHPNAPAPESMLQPEDIADAVFAAVNADSRACISEIDIRPNNPRRG